MDSKDLKQQRELARHLHEMLYEMQRQDWRQRRRPAERLIDGMLIQLERGVSGLTVVMLRPLEGLRKRKKR